MTKKRIMREFRIDEISAVDRPAQQSATVSIMKRDGSDVDKNDTVDLLTSVTNGHQHGIRVRRYSDCDGPSWPSIYVMYAAGTDENDHGHDHVLVINADGTVTVSENHGHTHEVDAAALQRAIMGQMMAKKEDGAVADPVADQAAKSQKENTTMTDTPEMVELKARLAKAEALASLNAEQRAVYDKFTTDAEREAFLAKSADERQAVVTKAIEATQVVYTDLKGRTYTKADDARLVELAKEADEAAKATEAANAAAAEADLEKRAQELKFLPGDLAARKALLKSIDAIPDKAQRDAAMAALKSKDGKLGETTKSIGSAGGDDVSGSTEIGDGAVEKSEAEAKLDALAKQHMEKNSVSFAKAYDAVLRTREGADLYAQIV